MQRVMIDPDGTYDDYVAVIVQHPTGVEYQQQCAGLECDLRVVEGFYVPLGGSKTEPDEGRVKHAELTAVFHEARDCVYGESPWHERPDRPRLPGDRLEALRAAVAAIPYWTSTDGREEHQRSALRLDESRILEIAEAWVPVISADGPGILTWPNCD